MEEESSRCEMLIAQVSSNKVETREYIDTRL